MRIADTSALYAAFVAEDGHHQEARAAFEVDEPTLVPAEILVETIGLLQFRRGYDPAAQALRAIMETDHITIAFGSPELVTTASSIYVECKGELSLADATVVAWCRAERAGPLTFDKALRRRARLTSA